MTNRISNTLTERCTYKPDPHFKTIGHDQKQASTDVKGEGNGGGRGGIGAVLFKTKIEINKDVHT